MRLKVKEIKCNLREWETIDFNKFEDAARSLNKLANLASFESDKFQTTCRVILRIVLEEKRRLKDVDLSSSIDSRAVAYLLARSSRFRESIKLDEEFFKTLNRARPSLSKLTVLFFMEAFFKHFDQLDQNNGHLNLANFILEHLRVFRKVDELSEMAILKKYAAILFSENGPSETVGWALNRGYEFELATKELGLVNFAGGRYVSLCRYRYYIETIKSIPVGSAHDVLSEVVKDDVFNAPGETGTLLGHEILSVLIDRSGTEVSDEWRRIVLTIAGDPRTPSTSPDYIKWWSILGEARIQFVRGWLSGFDLTLFLKVLEEYGNQSGNADLQRMYPSRKRFLEGLIKQGLVKGSRLFINPSAQRFLKTNYKKRELPSYATVRDSQRSMIYFQVGDLHVVEGSHSFKLWIFPQLPSDNNINNYNKKEFNPRELGQTMHEKYVLEYGLNAPATASITHVPNKLSWQSTAIKYFKEHGVILDLKKLFSESDYNTYQELQSSVSVSYRGRYRKRRRY